MMTLPRGVSIDPGQAEFVTQRGYFAPPYVSCMFAALSTLLIRAGYRLPLFRRIENTPPENFVFTLHKAVDPTPSSGTSQAQSVEALRIVFGDHKPPVLFGGMTRDEINQAIRDGAAVRVLVDCGKLPAFMKREVGLGYDGGHAVTLVNSRVNAGVTEYHWLDPMGRPAEGYSGIWVKWSDFRDALDKRADGLIKVALAYRNAAVEMQMIEELKAQVASLTTEVTRLTEALEIEEIDNERLTLERDDARLRLSEMDGIIHRP